MKNFKLIIVAVMALLSACSNNEEPPQPVADFKINLSVEQNEAVVSLHNLSQNASTYQWSFPNATLENSSDENPTVNYTKNGTYTISLTASDGALSDTKSMELSIDTLFEHVPYRYLENDGVFMYYETDNREVYQSLLPDEFEMPDRMLVFAFFNDFCKLDYGATPYKENALSILVKYQGEEFFHCVYMPVTDEHSMWAGILGLGLPKTMGEISFTRDTPVYYGHALNPQGGTMEMRVDTENFTIENKVRQEMIDLQKLRSLQIRNGKVIVTGNTGGNRNSVIETAAQFPNRISVKFGAATLITNTESIVQMHPLDLKPSGIIGAFYLKNTIPFGLTGSPF